MDSHVIQLTLAAHKYGNLNIRLCGIDFFPPDVFGGSSRKAGLGVPITLKVDGLPNPIKTDIPTDRITRKPRWIFRERSWVKTFVRANELAPGDTVTIERIDDRTYFIKTHRKPIPLEPMFWPITQGYKHTATNKGPLTYISLFSGAGIGCYGFTKEGFQCIATNELLEKRLKIQRYNNKCKYELGYICGDITQQSIKEKVSSQIELWRKEEKIDDIDVLIATPPCQGMSVANHKKKEELKRNSLVTESIILTKAIRPKFFIFENVRSFLKTLCIDTDGQLKPIKTAIETNLVDYNIHYEVTNFKDYGNPSQRTRALVIGVRKDLRDVTPYDVLPNWGKAPSLRQSIGHLRTLKKMGEINPHDIYHRFRPYPHNMLQWIKDLQEGHSAFENHDISKRPHKIKNGKLVINKNKNGDKYKRCYWNKPGFCIHTRNDQLASQMTIHPQDNRVFSIRELMILMSIPNDFKWTHVPFEKLNAMTYEEKRQFLKKEEMNIRQTIGEAVPTMIFGKVAHKIKNILQSDLLRDTDISKLIESNNLQVYENLYKFLLDNLAVYSFMELSRIAELANSKRLHNAAYYTSQDICYTIIKDLPNLEEKDIVKILEPSVGLGNFIPLLIKKYAEKKEILLDVVDVDADSIELLKLLLRKLTIPKNVKIDFINDDFLFGYVCCFKKYDIVVGNPPYKKVTNDKRLLAIYKRDKFNTKTNNIFAFFLEKALTLGKYVAFILPKSFLSTPEYNKTRKLLKKHNIVKICDYGEHAFKIKIETISIIVKTLYNERGNDKKSDVKIESYTVPSVSYIRHDYIFDSDYPCWLLYRNSFFDDVANKLEFDVFTVFRDRQITNKLLRDKGAFRVLKSRNVGNNRIIDMGNHDRYIDDLDTLIVAKYLNRRNVVMIPNLTYNPRASYLPGNCIADGSVALATPKNGYKITKKDLAYYASYEFRNFYKIARNHSTRSMNIDRNAIFFFGILK